MWYVEVKVFWWQIVGVQYVDVGQVFLFDYCCSDIGVFYVYICFVLGYYCQCFGGVGCVYLVGGWEVGMYLVVGYEGFFGYYVQVVQVWVGGGVGVIWVCYQCQWCIQVGLGVDYVVGVVGCQCDVYYYVDFVLVCCIQYFGLIVIQVDLYCYVQVFGYCLQVVVVQVDWFVFFDGFKGWLVVVVQVKDDGRVLFKLFVLVWWYCWCQGWVVCSGEWCWYVQYDGQYQYLVGDLGMYVV